MSPVIHDWIGAVHDFQGVSASEMTYIVSGGALNSTHSTHSPYMVVDCRRPSFFIYRRSCLEGTFNVCVCVDL